MGVSWALRLGGLNEKSGNNYNLNINKNLFH